ncbi:Zinc finger BED domain-containing protein RICESLEEPER 4, partial [Linum grandiflorum]
RAGRGAPTNSTEAAAAHPETAPTSSTVAPSASATVESTAPAPKKRKPTKKRSPYWIHYSCIIDEDGISKAECKYCKTLIYADSSNNGTSGLIAHYKRCLARLDDDQMALNLQSTLGVIREVGTLTTWKFNQTAAREALVVMIIIDELPFRYVEHQGFKQFMAVVCQMFVIPGRKTVREDCFRLFLKSKDKLIDYLMCRL